MVDLIITGALSVWFTLSVLNQFYRGKLIRPLLRFDRVGAIPIWTFFAPSPGRTDYHLLYRDVSFENALSPWREIDLHSRPPLYFLWNPQRRIKKAVNDLITHFLGRLRPPIGSAKGILIEVPYIMLLSFVCAQPRDFMVARRQFAIAQTDGFAARARPRVLYVSWQHKVPYPSDRLPTDDVRTGSI
jgi:hypothetical protein